MKNLLLPLASCLLVIACSKEIEPPQLHLRIAVPVYYSTNYTLTSDLENNYDIHHQSWYEMYQAVYDSSAANFLGNYISGAGYIHYAASPNNLVSTSFNTSDKQTYFELQQHVERFFYNHFKKIDSSLLSANVISDSLIFYTKDTIYKSLEFVDVTQQVLVNQKQ